MRSFLVPAFVAVVLLGITATPAWSHDLGGQAKLIKGQIEIEAYYDEGSDARGATVQVLNAQKKVVASGVTNARSVWTCKLLPPGEYTARIKHGGHLGIVKFAIKESGAQAQLVT